MYSRCRNPERRAAIARLLPIAVAAVLVVATNNAGAQQDTAQARVADPTRFPSLAFFPTASLRRLRRTRSEGGLRERSSPLRTANSFLTKGTVPAAISTAAAAWAGRSYPVIGATAVG